MFWENINDARNHLNSTLVKHPVLGIIYVEGCYCKRKETDPSDWYASVLYINDDDDFASKEISMDEIDLTPIPLGYLPIRRKYARVKSAFYATRQPLRRWKQGLDSRNVEFKDSEGHIVDVNMEALHRALHCVSTYGYPTIKEALSNPCKPTAFSSSFAAGEKHSVLFKGNRVGRVVKGKVQFRDRYLHLNKLLSQEIPYENT